MFWVSTPVPFYRAQSSAFIYSEAASVFITQISFTSLLSAYKNILKSPFKKKRHFVLEYKTACFNAIAVLLCLWALQWQHCCICVDRTCSCSQTETWHWSGTEEPHSAGGKKLVSTWPGQSTNDLKGLKSGDINIPPPVRPGGIIVQGRRFQSKRIVWILNGSRN